MGKSLLRSKVNYWKASTIGLLILLPVFQLFGVGIFGASSIDTGTIDTVHTTVVPSNTVVRDVADEVFKYPSNVFWLSKGDTSINSDDIYKKQYFTITLRPFPIGVTTFPEKIYKIPIDTMDYISDPKISHFEQYGCVTAGASGYSGYYIFTLPQGKKVAQGPQYSQCVEWISKHEVIIVENIYNTYDVTYSLFDTYDGSKKQLSSFLEQDL